MPHDEEHASSSERSQLRAWWGRLTDEDARLIETERSPHARWELLVAKLQERYETKRELAERELVRLTTRGALAMIEPSKGSWRDIHSAG